MSRNRRQSIRNPRLFRKGASRNAMNVDNQMWNLVKRKKAEIRQLVEDLKSKTINIMQFSESKRSVFFEINVGSKPIELKFIIWTDYREKDSDFSNSQFARFVLRPSESIDELRFRVLKYLEEKIQKGSTVEYIYTLALEELQKEHKILMFYKTGSRKDREGTDFVVIFLKDGRQVEMPYQVKSSYEALMSHKEEYKEIPGSWLRFTKNLREDIDRAKAKSIRVIEDYKEGTITFL